MEGTAMIGSIIIVGALAHCALLQFHVWFESHVDEHAVSSYLETYALQVWIGP